MLVNLVTTLIGHRPALAPEALIAGDSRAPTLTEARIAERAVWFEGGFSPHPRLRPHPPAARRHLPGPGHRAAARRHHVIEHGDEVEVDRLVI
jgi:hypothetical protein